MDRCAVLAAVCLSGLAGCDVVFRLDELPPGPHYPGQLIFDPNGDVDQDNVDNIADLCPTVDQTGTVADTDMDGVGDRCDPHPATPGDCLALFDDFENEAAPSPHWKLQGTTMAIEGDTYRSYLAIDSPNPDLSDEWVLYLDQPLDLDALYVWGYVQAGDLGTVSGRGALQVFTALQIDTVNNQLTGDGCGTESNGAMSSTAHVRLAAGAETTVTSTTIGSVLVGPPNDFWLSWGQKPSDCTGTLSGAYGNGTATITAEVPPSRVFALRGLSVGIHVYAIAGWGRACN